jgi:hypothetical protein
MVVLSVSLSAHAQLHILLLPKPHLRRIGQNLVLQHAREYVCVARALAPLALALASSNIISTLQAFHPSVLPSSCSNSLMDF